MDYRPIDEQRCSWYRKLLWPLRRPVAWCTRMLWRLSPASRSTWYYWTYTYRLVWDLNRAFACIPRIESTSIPVRMSRGVRMELDLSRLTDALAWSFGHGEFEMRFLARSFTREDSQILDIGGNVGTTALAFAEVVPQGRVHVFEPSPLMLPQLRRNIQISGFDHVVVHPFGLAATPSSAKLHVAIAGNPASAFVVVDGENSDPSIALERLDDVNDIGSPIDFVKIDVEGFELEVLRGANRLLKEDRPVIVFEVNEVALQRAGTSAREVMNYLHEFGYRFVQARSGQFEPYIPTDKQITMLHNAIAVHPENVRTRAIAEGRGKRLPV